MSNVTLQIGGRAFTVACAEGEEDHVLGLGRMIDGKLAAMDSSGGQNETRTLLFAALLLADELHEAKSAAVAEPPIPAAPVPTPAILMPHLPEPLPAGIALRLEALATRIEKLALHLEEPATSA